MSFTQRRSRQEPMLRGRFPTEPSLHTHGQPGPPKAEMSKEPSSRPLNVDEDSTQAGTPPGPSVGSAGSNVKIRNVSGSPTLIEVLTCFFGKASSLKMDV